MAPRCDTPALCAARRPRVDPCAAVPAQPRTPAEVRAQSPTLCTLAKSVDVHAHRASPRPSWAAVVVLCARVRRQEVCVAGAARARWRSRSMEGSVIWYRR